MENSKTTKYSVLYVHVKTKEGNQKDKTVLRYEYDNYNEASDKYDELIIDSAKHLSLLNVVKLKIEITLLIKASTYKGIVMSNLKTQN